MITSVIGLSTRKEYKKCHSAIRRCTNPNDKDYIYYSNRKVEQEWIDNPREMVRYILNTIGPCPRGKELDREDNNQGYIKGNIRWVTHKENMRNR